MANTTNRSWPIPTLGKNPWYQEFITFANSVDSDINTNMFSVYNTIGSAASRGALRQNTGSTGRIAYAKGFWTRGDGGGGFFIWETGSAVDNGGTIIVPTGQSAGYWSRIFEGPVNAKWFGARGTGNDTNYSDSESLQDALDFVESAGGGTVFLPKTTYGYVLKSSVYVGENTTLDCGMNKIVCYNNRQGIGFSYDFTNNSGVIILGVIGNGSTSKIQNAHLKNCVMEWDSGEDTTAVQMPILMVCSENSSVTYCKVTFAAGWGVGSFWGKNNEVSRCTIFSPGGHGVATGGNDCYVEENFTARRNVIENSGLRAFDVHCAGQGALLEDNIALDCNGFAKNYIGKLRVINNRMRMSLSSPPTWNILLCHEGSEVSNNIIENASASSIHISSPPSDAEFWTCPELYSDFFQPDEDFQEGLTPSASNSIIRGNILLNYSDEINGGITVTGWNPDTETYPNNFPIQGVIISENIIVSTNVRNAIYANPYALSNSIISGNIIRGTETQESLSDRNGIYIGNSCENNIIIGNQVDLIGVETANHMALQCRGNGSTIIGNMLNAEDSERAVFIPAATDDYRFIGNYSDNAFYTQASVTDKSVINALNNPESGYVAGSWPKYHEPITGAGSPVGSVTPRRVGDDYLDTVASKFYKSTSLLSASWVILN